MMYDYDLLAAQLDQILTPANGEAGPRLSIGELVDALDVPENVVKLAVRHHRNYLSDETRALLCQAQRGAGPRFLYWLSVDAEEIKSYDLARTADTETRIRTIREVHARMVRYTDGRTIEGKRARIIAKHLSRLLEDIDDITAST